MGRDRKRRRPKTGEEPIVSPFAAQHGQYRQQFIPQNEDENRRNNQRMVAVVRNDAVTVVDKWLKDGGPGFEEPQGRAIGHVRGLWAIIGGGPSLIANYVGVGGGAGDREGYMAALHALSKYEAEFPPWIWEAFEMVVRHDEPAGVAGSRLANNSPQRQSMAKACVGFVASKIAEWRGY